MAACYKLSRGHSKHLHGPKLAKDKAWFHHAFAAAQRDPVATLDGYIVTHCDGVYTFVQVTDWMTNVRHTLKNRLNPLYGYISIMKHNGVKFADEALQEIKAVIADVDTLCLSE